MKRLIENLMVAGIVLSETAMAAYDAVFVIQHHFPSMSLLLAVVLAATYAAARAGFVMVDQINRLTQ